ncbi:MAG: signal peptide peptidase SppA, partial [Deltaproteobacteria bacterium]|nr:signal peptide peptidase SppA [Deltaproteobacteria bacterium]
SPGGGLTDSDVIYHSIMEFKRAKKVKVVAALGDVAASGGLYIAMSADEIIAHPTSLLGSIGVILSHMEFSGLMEKYGVTAVPVTSGKFKDIESPFRKRTPEETRMLQKIVDHQYQTFLSVVQKGRSKMTPEIIQENADGRLLTSREAVRIGLIDDVGYLDDAYKRLGVISGFPTNRLVRYANSWMTGNNIYSNVFPIESTGF